MSRDPDVGHRLRDVRVPDEEGAQERALEIVRAAHAERSPAAQPRSARRLALAAAGGLAVLAIGLSPAGAKVGDLVSDVVGIGEEDARPALRSLPAAGELLVQSGQGPWIVREDGSKRLLGGYGDATWSPRGLFVAVADGRALVAVEPDGTVRWSIPASGLVHDPRWSPSGYRIAYRSGDDLRVAAGDGTGDELVAREVSPVAPAWRPIDPDSKVAADGSGSHVLTYVDGEKRIRAVDVDSGARVPATTRDLEQLSTPPAGGPIKRATSPDGSRLATLEHVGRRDQLVVLDRARKQVLFSARGVLTGPTWSPDGRWLLVGWPAADQWLFIDAERPRHVIAFDRISEQFDPGGAGEPAFPRVSGWILPER